MTFRVTQGHRKCRDSLDHTSPLLMVCINSISVFQRCRDIFRYSEILVENRQIYLTHPYCHLRWGGPMVFHQHLQCVKTALPSYRSFIIDCLTIGWIVFNTVPACRRRTDRETNGIAIAIALCITVLCWCVIKSYVIIVTHYVEGLFKGSQCTIINLEVTRDTDMISNFRDMYELSECHLKYLQCSFIFRIADL